MSSITSTLLIAATNQITIIKYDIYDRRRNFSCTEMPEKGGGKEGEFNEL